jgi:hypothetical protein
MCALNCAASRERKFFALGCGPNTDDMMMVRSIMYGMMPGIPARPARMQHSTFLTVRPASGDRVWTPGAAVPPPGVHTVELPFALDLPATLAPTFSATGRAPCEHAVMDAYIEYSVVVLAGRRGLFKRDLLLEQPVAITPCAHPVDVAARAALTAGPWPGPWKILEKQSRLSSPKSNGGYEVCVQAGVQTQTAERAPTLFAACVARLSVVCCFDGGACSCSYSDQTHGRTASRVRCRGSFARYSAATTGILHLRMRGRYATVKQHCY